MEKSAEKTKINSLQFKDVTSDGCVQENSEITQLKHKFNSIVEDVNKLLEQLDPAIKSKLRKSGGPKVLPLPHGDCKEKTSRKPNLKSNEECNEEMSSESGEECGTTSSDDSDCQSLADDSQPSDEVCSPQSPTSIQNASRQNAPGKTKVFPLFALAAQAGLSLAPAIAKALPPLAHVATEAVTQILPDVVEGAVNAVMGEKDPFQKAIEEIKNKKPDQSDTVTRVVQHSNTEKVGTKSPQPKTPSESDDSDTPLQNPNSPHGPMYQSAQGQSPAYPPMLRGTGYPPVYGQPYFQPQTPQIYGAPVAYSQAPIQPYGVPFGYGQGPFLPQIPPGYGAPVMYSQSPSLPQIPPGYGAPVMYSSRPSPPQIPPGYGALVPYSSRPSLPQILPGYGAPVMYSQSPSLPQIPPGYGAPVTYSQSPSLSQTLSDVATSATHPLKNKRKKNTTQSKTPIPHSTKSQIVDLHSSSSSLSPRPDGAPTPTRSSPPGGAPIHTRSSPPGHIPPPTRSFPGFTPEECGIAGFEKSRDRSIAHWNQHRKSAEFYKYEEGVLGSLQDLDHQISLILNKLETK